MAFSIRKEEPRKAARPIQQNRDFGFSNYSVETDVEDPGKNSTNPASDPNQIMKERVKRFHGRTGEEHITSNHKKAMKEICAEERSFFHTLKSLFLRG